MSSVITVNLPGFARCVNWISLSSISLFRNLESCLTKGGQIWSYGQQLKMFLLREVVALIILFFLLKRKLDTTYLEARLIEMSQFKWEELKEVNVCSYSHFDKNAKGPDQL